MFFLKVSYHINSCCSQ